MGWLWGEGSDSRQNGPCVLRTSSVSFRTSSRACQEGAEGHHDQIGHHAPHRRGDADRQGRGSELAKLRLFLRSHLPLLYIGLM